jgi:hypothetical protein
LLPFQKIKLPLEKNIGTVITITKKKFIISPISTKKPDCGSGLENALYSEKILINAQTLLSINNAAVVRFVAAIKTNNNKYRYGAINNKYVLISHRASFE